MRELLTVLPWALFAAMTVIAGIVIWTPCEKCEESRAEGFAGGEAARDRYVAGKLAEGKVLRARADGTPVWVRERTGDGGVLRPVDEPERPAPLVGAVAVSDGSGLRAAADHRLREPGRGQEDAPRAGWRDRITDELSPAALDGPAPPAGEAPAWRDGGPAGPGHWYADGLHWLADWRLEHQADAQRVDEQIAAWAEGSRLALAGASWADRLR